MHQSRIKSLGDRADFSSLPPTQTSASRLVAALRDCNLAHYSEAGPEAVTAAQAELTAARRELETPEQVIARLLKESRTTWDRAQAQRAVWDGYVGSITYRLKNGDVVGAAMLERTADGVLRHVNRLEADSDRLSREAANLKFKAEQRSGLINVIGGIR